MYIISYVMYVHIILRIRGTPIIGAYFYNKCTLTILPEQVHIILRRSLTASSMETVAYSYHSPVMAIVSFLERWK